MIIPLKGGDEQDVLTKARKHFCYTQRPGTCKIAKRSYNRRLRQFMNKCAQLSSPSL